MPECSLLEKYQTQDRLRRFNKADKAVPRIVPVDESVARMVFEQVCRIKRLRRATPEQLAALRPFVSSIYLAPTGHSSPWTRETILALLLLYRRDLKIEVVSETWGNLVPDAKGDYHIYPSQPTACPLAAVLHGQLCMNMADFRRDPVNRTEHDAAIHLARPLSWVQGFQSGFDDRYVQGKHDLNYRIGITDGFWVRRALCSLRIPIDGRYR